MAWNLKRTVLLATLVTTVTASKNCVTTKSYVLCNEVTINILQGGKYPMNTSSVEAIHFNSNNLTHLNENAFTTISCLKYIVIIHNLIEHLETGLFWNLKELVHLDLTDNRIKFLSSTAFISQTKLKNLLLGYNQLETLDSRVFLPLDLLSNLELIHNPFVCDCELQDVINWCEEKRLAVNTTCSDGTLWSAWNSTVSCDVTESYVISVEFTSSTNLTTEISSENLIKHESSRPFTTQEIATIAGTIIVLVVCIVVGLYFWKRSNICFKESDRAKNIGRTDIEDCRNEFVSSNRHRYLSESLSDTASCEQEQNLVSNPECESLRKPSESDSIYLDPSRVTEMEDPIPELPDLAVAYAEPFQRRDSPPPVYAVPFNKSDDKYNWIQNDMYSIPEFREENIKYSKGKRKH